LNVSVIKSIMHQLGLSGDPAKNFTLSVPAAPDGTMKLARGNAGATTQDILTVDANGMVAFPATPTQEIGVGQTWQDVTAGKTSGGALTNTTGRPIMASIRSVSGVGVSGAAQVDVGGVVVQRNLIPATTGVQSITVASAIVPAGSSYAYTWTGTPTIVELR
jgi:hypothetical protein